MELDHMNPHDIESFKFRASSPAVGGYRVGAITFALPKKPRWIHRMGVRLVLGWKWVDA
jgi:hypothetical protein